MRPGPAPAHPLHRNDLTQLWFLRPSPARCGGPISCNVPALASLGSGKPLTRARGGAGPKKTLTGPLSANVRETRHPPMN